MARRFMGYIGNHLRGRPRRHRRKVRDRRTIRTSTSWNCATANLSSWKPSAAGCLSPRTTPKSGSYWPRATRAAVSSGTAGKATSNGRRRKAMLEGAGKEAGLDAAKTAAAAVENVGDKVASAAAGISQELGRDLADAVNIMAGSLNRLEATLAAESAAWRAEYARTNDALLKIAGFLDRIRIAQ